MRLLKAKISIRIKILSLTIVALTASLVSYIYVGTTLIERDKTAYIYDTNLSESRSGAMRLESQLDQVLTSARVLASLINPKLLVSNQVFIEQSYQQSDARGLVDGMLFLRALDKERFGTEASFGKTANDLTRKMEELGWKPRTFEAQKVLFGQLDNGTLPIGARVTDGNGNPLVVFTLIKLNSTMIEPSKKEFTSYLLSPTGKLMLAAGEGPLDSTAIEELARTTLKEKFDSGTNEWENASRPYLVAYSRTAQGGFIVVGLVPKELAFEGAKALRLRSLVLGISMLLLSIGFTFAFLKRMTARLIQMAHATQRVSEGDFSVRVEIPTNSSEDEVVSLARSYNAMADKIDELFLLSAEKVRMEKELETAHEVQARFFPAEPLRDSIYGVAGRAFAASECGGDWWNYHVNGEQVIVVIGDVTGHGVQAALVTAAAHAVYSQAIEAIVPEDSPRTSSVTCSCTSTAR